MSAGMAGNWWSIGLRGAAAIPIRNDHFIAASPGCRAARRAVRGLCRRGRRICDPGRDARRAVGISLADADPRGLGQPRGRRRRPRLAGGCRRPAGSHRHRGRRVILSFYPADWSPVCGDQITLYNHVRREFQNCGAEIIGISVDGAWCHQAYARHNHIHFPLLADFHPKGAVAQKYGAYRSRMACANAPSL